MGVGVSGSGSACQISFINIVRIMFGKETAKNVMCVHLCERYVVQLILQRSVLHEAVDQTQGTASFTEA